MIRKKDHILCPTRLLAFKIRLKNESRVGTPIRRNLVPCPQNFFSRVKLSLSLYLAFFQTSANQGPDSTFVDKVNS